MGSAHYVVPLGPRRYADAHGMCTLCLCPRLPCPSPRVCAHSHDCTTTGGSSGGGLFGNTAMMTANQPQPQTGGGGGSLFGSSASNQPQLQSGGGGGGLFGSSSSATNQPQQTGGVSLGVERRTRQRQRRFSPCTAADRRWLVREHHDNGRAICVCIRISKL